MDNEIAGKNVNQLKQLCRDNRLSSRGNKRELVERLKEFFRAQNQADDDDQEDENNGNHNANGGRRNSHQSQNGMNDENQQRRRRGRNDGAGDNSRLHSDDEDDVIPEQRRPMRKSAFSFKDIEESLDKFDGENQKDVKQWIEDFEAQSEIFGWGDLERLVYARRLLTGAAKLYASCELRPKTWIQLKNGLEKEFEIKVNSALIHKKLSETKKKRDETFREYCYRMIDIAAPGKIETAAVVTYIVDGIHDTTTNKLFLYSANTISELKEKIRVYEEATKKDSSNKTTTKEKDDEKKKHSDRKSSKSDRSNRCFNCGSGEHLSHSCPDKDKGPKCFKCDSFGHKSASCSKNVDKDKKKDEKVSSCVLIVPNRTRVKKEIVINNKSVVASFDSCSDITAVQQSALKRYNFGKMKRIEDFPFDGVGSSNRALGYLEVKVEADNEIYDDYCFVIQDQEGLPEVIIGLTLINQTESMIITENGITLKKLQPKPKLNDINKTNEAEEECALHPMCALILENQSNVPELTHIRNKEVKAAVEKLVTEYKPMKTKESPIELKIILNDETPIYQRARRLPPKMKETVSNQVKEWIELKVIKPSTSDFAANVVPVPKKDNTTRVCVDYRLINRKIIKDRFPLPVIDDQIDALEGARVFSVLDLENGFFHVPIAPESRKYTSFITSDGQFEFLRAPFGLCTSPNVFMRFVNKIYTELIANGTVVPYMDDVIIPAATEEEGLQKLKAVLKVASEYGLNIKWKKCKLLQRKIEFLGYEIEDGKLRSAVAKTIDVKNYKEPKNAKQLDRFLGLTGYFRKYVSGYAFIAKPLKDITRQNVKFEFGTAQKLAFEKLKEIITSRPVLIMHRYGVETEVHTDASKFGLGGILFQRSNDDNQMHPVRYWSRKTTDAEQKWISYELEVLAVVEALYVWRVYLQDYPFKVITDCKAFADAMDKKETSPKIARWAMRLQKYDMKVVHRSGSQMKHVDALSRCHIIQLNGLIDSLKRNQQKDDHLKPIIDIINEKGSYENYMLSNELLYYKVDDEKRLVVPEKMQFEIIKQAHDQGHFKTKKMEEIIKREFYIPKLKEKIERFVHNCVTCILTDRKAGKQEGMLHPIPKEDRPLTTLHLDHLGPMESTRKNYKHILTIVDAFTKFVWIFPVKSTTSEETMKKLQLLTATFGNPSRVITDKGTAFTGSMFKDFCRDENIEVVHTTTGVPRGNGQVERIHRVIISVLAKLSIENPEKWFQHTEKVQQFLNKTHQRAIGMTPFELLFGVPMKTKEDVQMKEIIEQEVIESFVEEREQLRERAKVQILALKEENKRTFNAKRKPATQHEVGDLVAIKRTQFGSGLKLHSKNFGPYKVVKSKGNDRYEVQKLGIHDGPYCTTSSADYMIRWTDYEDMTSFGE